MPSTRLIAVFAVACKNLNVAAAIAIYTHRRVSKLPVGRARPRPSRLLEPLVVREERHHLLYEYLVKKRKLKAVTDSCQTPIFEIAIS